MIHERIALERYDLHPGVLTERLLSAKRQEHRRNLALHLLDAHRVERGHLLGVGRTTARRVVGKRICAHICSPISAPLGPSEILMLWSCAHLRNASSSLSSSVVTSASGNGPLLGPAP